jgi:hypothetical protein
MEFVTLLEALVIISNQIGHYERQAEFITKISATFIQQFQSLQPHYRYDHYRYVIKTGRINHQDIRHIHLTVAVSSALL